MTRIIPIFLALLVAVGAAYWFFKPAPDIRFTRFETELREIGKSGKLIRKVPRNSKVEVVQELTESGVAVAFVDTNVGGVINLADLDTDRRPVLTGAYVAKALVEPVKLRAEPSPLAPIVAEIPARELIQIWGQTETPSGKWAEITRHKDKAVGYLPVKDLEAASHQLR
ncbi:hypothetical protein PbB2_00604 [Candidatus Phycosocius bacilliformis]|uniref:Uncharacterized protein n=1 Tax=Candidatus Phycosocius bacilliformis TaxID=1445552 RepID=A0A2P2E7A8_9PROT|nr:hypothetical protein [Candidatus Phycosocius bacilliformis]GBF56947.1 hypothetical protein PbB2_00604 [Candidatus Phycosocius bacilliformis]